MPANMKKTKGKFSFFTRLLIFVNGTIALALLIAYLAPVIDPRTFWPVAFFGLAYPPLLLLNALFIVYWLIVRSKLALISVITILIGWNVLLNNIGLSVWNKQPEPAANSFRLLTYNVHHFSPFGEDKNDAIRHDILSTIISAKPDIVGMQEYYSRKKGRYAMTDSISQLIKVPYYHAEANMESTKEMMGIAIFSRFPIISKGVVTIGEEGSGNQCIYADIKKDGQILRFYCVHLQSIQFEPQDYQYLDTVAKSGKADLSSTKRLGGKLKRAFLKRAEQVLTIKQHASASPYPYVISGDFNDTPTSFAVNQMAKGIKNTFREKGFGLGRTYNGDFPNYQIDYIMASNRFDVSNYEIIKQKLSDHYPVYADLVLK